MDICWISSDIAFLLFYLAIATEWQNSETGASKDHRWNNDGRILRLPPYDGNNDDENVFEKKKGPSKDRRYIL